MFAGIAVVLGCFLTLVVTLMALRQSVQDA
jgi:hypothetical protein